MNEDNSQILRRMCTKRTWGICASFLGSNFLPPREIAGLQQMTNYVIRDERVIRHWLQQINLRALLSWKAASQAQWLFYNMNWKQWERLWLVAWAHQRKKKQSYTWLYLLFAVFEWNIWITKCHLIKKQNLPISKAAFCVSLEGIL